MPYPEFRAMRPSQLMLAYDSAQAELIACIESGEELDPTRRDRLRNEILRRLHEQQRLEQPAPAPASPESGPVETGEGGG